MKNILEIILTELEIPYTHSFASKIFNEHPYRENMLGLQQILETYEIKTLGIKFEKKDLGKLPVPCILHIPDKFIVVTNISESNISYIWNNKTIQESISDFQNRCTGNALIIENIDEAAEPDYNTHQKQQRINQIGSILAIVSLFCYILIQISLNQTTYNPLSISIAFFDIIGISLCCLLMQKQLFQVSKIGDKVCSFFHQGDCNSILFSEKSRIGPFHWSEIGLSYFVIHLLFSFTHPETLLMLCIVGWCAMLYGVWSIYYQSIVAKQWCVLCISVQIVLWLNGICSAILIPQSYFHTEYLVLASHTILYTTGLYILLIFIHKITQSILDSKTLTEITYKYNSLKSSKKVFEVLLHESDYYQTDKNDSSIIFGNPNAPLRITILTNPHCNPCAKMHKKVEKLLHCKNNKICVQYIFTSFNEELEESCKFLIAAYQQLNQRDVEDLYSKWYEKGNLSDQDFIKQHGKISTLHKKVRDEMKHHDTWKQHYGFHATPTILVNGYLLPSHYSIEDLIVISNLL